MDVVSLALKRATHCSASKQVMDRLCCGFCLHCCCCCPQGSAETGESSYASLVGRVLGPAGEGLLQAALFGFCFGVMAVYLVVCGDVLAGETEGGGVHRGAQYVCQWLEAWVQDFGFEVMAVHLVLCGDVLAGEAWPMVRACAGYADTHCVGGWRRVEGFMLKRDGHHDASLLQDTRQAVQCSMLVAQSAHDMAGHEARRT